MITTFQQRERRDCLNDAGQAQHNLSQPVDICGEDPQRHGYQQGQDRIHQNQAEIDTKNPAKFGSDSFHYPNLAYLLHNNGVDRVVNQKQPQDQGRKGHQL